ncbi:MAG TPA: hypothetical protein VHE83_16895 [Mycobacteriales bacterium]|nr:hypothetical protein [Mycobacteriales bacterium]
MRAAHRTATVPLAVLTAVWLAVTAYVHADLAPGYDALKQSGTLSQGELFRAQAGVASAAALLVLVAALTSARWMPLAWLVASVSGLGSFAAVLLYRYDDVGKVLFLPDMYEPVWFREKTVSAIADAAAFVVGLIGLLVALRGRRRPTATAA